MVIKVVDASAVAAVLFGEPAASGIVGELCGSRLVAPTLLLTELANVCVVKMRRHPEQQTVVADAFRLRGRFGIEMLLVDYDGVVQLAATTGLTAYDASYLWLARSIGAELVTLDRQLARAALAS